MIIQDPSLNNYQVAWIVLVLSISGLATGFWLWIKHKAHMAKKQHWKDKKKM